jgi:hypothetical protein
VISATLSCSAALSSAMYLPFGKRHQASGYRHQGELSFLTRGTQRTPGGFIRTPI